MTLEKRINALKARKKVLEEDIIKNQSLLEEHEKEKESALEAKIILQTAATNTQKNLEIHFSNIVTKALKIIFEDPYTFVPKFVERRNKTECDLWLVKDNKMLRPKFAVGGGVRDIVSFALRLSYWKLERSSPVILLDEPFKNLSRHLIPKAVDTLKFLADKFQLQLIIVTHIPEIAQQADRLFEVEQGNVTTVF